MDVVSTRYSDSKWVMHELDLALNARAHLGMRGRPVVVPVLFDDARELRESAMYTEEGLLKYWSRPEHGKFDHLGGPVPAARWARNVVVALMDDRQHLKAPHGPEHERNKDRQTALAQEVATNLDVIAADFNGKRIVLLKHVGARRADGSRH